MSKLPLIINTKHKDWLKVFAPVDGQPLADGDKLITIGEDLEKLEVYILVRLYNQANPGLKVNAFKPGTVAKYCLPSLIKLADKQLAGEDTPETMSITKTKGKVKTEKVKSGEPSLSSVIRDARLAGKKDEAIFKIAEAHPKYANDAKKARNYAKMYLKHYVDNKD